MTNSRYRVAILVEASRGHGRDVIKGIARYSAEHGPWSLRLEPRNLDDPPPRWLKTWEGDGIIVRCDSVAMVKAVKATGLALIDVRGGVPDADIPLVGVDNDAVVEAAFGHFLERGFRNIAWCDFFGWGRGWMDRRRSRLFQLANEAEVPCGVFRGKHRTQKRVAWSHQEMDQLMVWLSGLPRPVAVLACDDEQAHLVLEAARQLGLRVPDDLAVLGIDNDDVFCRVSNPPLSSIDVNAVAVGYKAAEMLERRIKGRRIPEHTMLPPRGIVTRQSTDIVAVENSEAAAALSYIRENACQPIQAHDVADELSISRSTLDRCLRVAVGTSATEAIMRVRLEHVRADLANTDLSLSAIAARAGFTSVQHFANLFHKRVGVTPGQYRRDTRH